MNSKKVLIVGPNWVGDMMMAQSLMISLKQQNPESIIDVLAPNWTKALTSRMPEVNQAILSPFKQGALDLKGRLQLGKKLKEANYDEAYILPNAFKSALVPFFARIPKRVGWCGEARFGLLNDLRFLDKKAYPLMVQRFGALAHPAKSNLGKEIHRPRLVLQPTQVASTLVQFGLPHGAISDKKIMAVCPGAEFGPSKRWPEAHFVALMEKLAQNGWTIWLFGSEKDKHISEYIFANSKVDYTDFVGKTSLDQAIDLLSVVQGVVTNDSGLMHIACALDKPVVAIYGSTSTGFTPPLGRNQIEVVQMSLPCSPCFKRTCPLGHHQCMQDITPDSIFKAVNKVCAF